jgi:hypothetical protein
MKTMKENEKEYINSYNKEKPTAILVIIAFLAAGGLFAIIYGVAWLFMNLLPEICK